MHTTLFGREVYEPHSLDDSDTNHSILESSISTLIVFGRPASIHSGRDAQLDGFAEGMWEGLS